MVFVAAFLPNIEGKVLERFVCGVLDRGSHVVVVVVVCWLLLFVDDDEEGRRKGLYRGVEAEKLKTLIAKL